ncbi:uncharacterized protein [Macrobrachium rosenbergii]|uniref:uncharacterized protein n=1 Tax=Macrobrachium rosenbergii TaxID=79674 RepID=UPI0034D5E692
MEDLGQHQDLESMADHHQTCKEENETGTCHGDPHTGRTVCMEDFSHAHMQEAYNVKNGQYGQEVPVLHRQQYCNPHGTSIPCTNNRAHALSEVDLSDLYDLGTLINKRPCKAHKSNETDVSQLFEDRMNMKSIHAQQLDRSEDTGAFIPLVKEEMEEIDYSESCDPQPLFQPFEETESKEAHQSQHAPGKKEVEGFARLLKEETEYQNCTDPHHIKVRDEGSCVGEEHPVIKEPSHCAELKDMKGLFHSLQREIADEENYTAPYDAKVGIRETIDGKANSVVRSQPYVEETQDDGEKCIHPSNQEIKEPCIKDESPDADKKSFEISIHPVEAAAYENYIESDNTRVKIEETLDRNKDTRVHSKETLYDGKQHRHQCGQETFYDEEQRRHQCEQEVEEPCVTDQSRTHTQESENEEDVNEMNNPEHQLTRSPKVKIVYNTRITMRGIQKNDQIP